jgi:DNA-binding transcriptional LysR family regulator
MRTFVVAAGRGSWGAPAAHLGYARSTVSYHLRSLERSFGVQLFRRSGQGRELTVAGEALLAHAEIVLDHLDLAKAELGDSQSAGETVLRLGVTEPAGTYRLPGLMRMINRAFPKVRVVADSDSAEVIRERFDAGRLDAMLLSGVGSFPAGTPYHLLWEEPVVLVGAPGGQTSGPVLVAQPGCVFRKIVEDEYLGHVPGAAMMQIGSLEAVKSGVCAGLGVGLLPAVAVRSHLASGALVELPWRTSRRVITGMYWDPRRCPAEVVEWLLRLRGTSDAALANL